MESLASWAYKEAQLCFSHGDYRDAFVLCEKALTLNKDSADAQHLLGEMLREGRGCEKDVPRALQLWEKSSAGGSALAAYNLGCAHVEGCDVAQDLRKAVSYFALAAKRGDSDAAFNLGQLYKKGEGVAKDSSKAARFFTLGIENAKGEEGLAVREGAYILATMYKEGAGVPQSDKKSFDFNMKAAMRGYPAAMYNVAYGYQTGEGVAKDLAKARKFYGEAAEAGCIEAVCNLGIMLIKGEGGSEAQEEGFRLLETAAAQGNVPAQVTLDKHKAMLDDTYPDLFVDGASTSTATYILQRMELIGLVALTSMGMFSEADLEGKFKAAGIVDRERCSAFLKNHASAGDTRIAQECLQDFGLCTLARRLDPQGIGDADACVTVDWAGTGEFTSIREAIHHLEDTGKHNATIRIKPGIYNEHILVRSPHVGALVGDARGTSSSVSVRVDDKYIERLEGVGIDWEGKLPAALAAVGPVRLENITFEASYSKTAAFDATASLFAVILAGGGDCKNCSFLCHNGNGLSACSGEAAFTAKHCRFEQCVNGLGLRVPSKLSDCTFTRCERSGVRLYSGVEIEMTDCEVSSNLLYGIEYAAERDMPEASPGAVLRLSSSTISGNAKLLGNNPAGVHVWKGALITTKCAFNDNGGSGVASIAAKVEIESCTFSNNRHAGISFLEHSEGVVQSSSFENNGHGILNFNNNGGNLELSSNSFSNNMFSDVFGDVLNKTQQGIDIISHTYAPPPAESLVAASKRARQMWRNAEAAGMSPAQAFGSSPAMMACRPTCGGCGKVEPQTLKFLKCSGCRFMQYCSRKCQKKDWRNHKQNCVGTPDSVNPDESASNVGYVSDECPERCQSTSAASAFPQMSSTSSNISSSSLISAAGSNSRCFLADALFKMPDGRFIRACDLVVDTTICAAGDETTKVADIKVIAGKTQDLVNLKTRTAVLVVTATHRVIVQRKDGPQTLQASALHVGSTVLIGGGVSEELTNVECFEASLDVVQITFVPDQPVEAFHPLQTGILSKGHGWSKTRRSKKKKQHPDDASKDAISIPDTDASWMYEAP